MYMLRITIFVLFSYLVKGCARANDSLDIIDLYINVHIDRTSLSDEQLLCAFDK